MSEVNLLLSQQEGDQNETYANKIITNDMTILIYKSNKNIIAYIVVLNPVLNPKFLTVQRIIGDFF